jgi:ribosomal protein L36
MKVRVSKREVLSKIVRRKGRLYVINKRILDLNKDKDNYGKNNRGRYPKNKRGVIALTYIFGLSC